MNLDKRQFFIQERATLPKSEHVGSCIKGHANH